MRALFLILALIPVAFPLLQAQDWHPPVDPPVRLSGSFGELRSSHFHAGIDVKSKRGTVGDPIYAVAGGYISRVRVDAASYGNAIYIDHPNGYTSLYGHLGGFMPELARWVKKKQYELESFEIDIRPGKEELPVEKGQQIGTMGTSGYSFGPHLHFELRNTETEKALHPIHLGIGIEDDYAPYFRRLYTYGLDEDNRTLDRKTWSLRRASPWRLAAGVARAAYPRIGIGLEVFDRMNATPNTNDIYSLELYLDDSLHYAFRFDSLSFRQGRYIHAHQDYNLRREHRRKVHRLFRLPGNYHDLFSENTSDGTLRLEPGDEKKVRIIATDHTGNSAVLAFEIQAEEHFKASPDRGGYLLLYDQPNWICFEGVEVRIPDSALYQNEYIEAGLIDDQSEGVLSDVIRVGDPRIPLHKPFEVYLYAPEIPARLRSKTAMSQCDYNNTYLYPGEWLGDIFASRTGTFGSYTLAVDTMAPQIVPLSFPVSARYGSSFRFRAKDNYRHDLGSDALKFEGRVDGKWVLVEYDYKNDLLTYIIDRRIQPGKHEFVLLVEDPLGNRATFRRSFTLQ